MFGEENQIRKSRETVYFSNKHNLSKLGKPRLTINYKL